MCGGNPPWGFGKAFVTGIASGRLKKRASWATAHPIPAEASGSPIVFPARPVPARPFLSLSCLLFHSLTRYLTQVYNPLLVHLLMLYIRYESVCNRSVPY